MNKTKGLFTRREGNPSARVTLERGLKIAQFLSGGVYPITRVNYSTKRGKIVENYKIGF